MRELTCYQVPSTPDCQADGSQSRQLIVGMDGILNDIAGPQGQDVHWTSREPWPLMQCNAFKRLLYKAMATFLRKAKVDVEQEYKWLVRYTPKYYCMLLPVIPEANKLGLRPDIPTTSSSSASTAVSTDLTLTADTLALHKGRNPSNVKDNKRIPTPERDVTEKSRSTRVKEDKTPH